MSRGHDRERSVADLMEGQGWYVTRAAGSLGMFDLVGLKAGEPPRLVEVKSTAGGPWERFGPVQRAACIDTARQAGAVAELAWWPKAKPGQRVAEILRWIPVAEWPSSRESAQ